MTPMLHALELAAALFAAAPPAPAFPPARPVVPFTVEGDVGCHWTMHDPKEKWVRGGIGQGDEDPLLELVDDAFASWSDDGLYAIEVSAGDPARRLPASAWTTAQTHPSIELPGSIGFYMGPELRKLIGGATSVQIWKDGKPVFNAALAATPSAAELDACVRAPIEGDGDSE